MAVDPVYIVSPDIEEQILIALGIMFKEALVTNIPSTDSLRLNVLKVAPLQDDPTLTAPYLTYGQDELKGIELMPHSYAKQYGDIEIGGPIRYLYHYTATCGTPFQSTRELCLAQINNLANRVVMTLINHFALSDIIPGMSIMMSADESKRIEGANKMLVDSILPTLEGGEQTWFGKAIICWHYPVAWWV